MKFGSWTYDGFQVMDENIIAIWNLHIYFVIKLLSFHFIFHPQLDLQLQDEAGGDISSFVTNGEWDLLGTDFYSFFI
jgi:hypothetical protein